MRNEELGIVGFASNWNLAGRYGLPVGAAIMPPAQNDPRKWYKFRQIRIISHSPKHSKYITWREANSRPYSEKGSAANRQITIYRSADRSKSGNRQLLHSVSLPENGKKVKTKEPWGFPMKFSFPTTILKPIPV